MAAVDPSANFVICTGCGTTNRIPSQTARGRPICGACRMPLLSQDYSPPANPFLQRLVRFLRQYYCWFILLTIITAAIWNNNKPPSTHSSSIKPKTYSTPTPAPTFNKPKLPLPANGFLQVFTTREAVAPFEIKSDYDSNYLVKLVDSNNSSTVITVFVHGGLTATVDVPLGTYDVRYASGDAWYGYEHLFGPSTTYSKADRLFTFRQDGLHVSGYTITLYKVRYGNLQTSRIHKDQF